MNPLLWLAAIPVALKGLKDGIAIVWQIIQLVHEIKGMKNKAQRAADLRVAMKEFKETGDSAKLEALYLGEKTDEPTPPVPPAA